MLVVDDEKNIQRTLRMTLSGEGYDVDCAGSAEEGLAKLPLSPYGVTKLTGELYLNYYRKIHGLEYVAVRYGNVFGPRQDPHGEAGVIAIFSSRLLSGDPLTVEIEGDLRQNPVPVEQGDGRVK